jgi:hypothetical protein
MTDTPSTVIIGVIDDGIAFAHKRFRIGNGSRVKYFWMQDGVYGGPGGKIDYGRELDPTAIQNLMDTHTRNGSLDEDGLYRAAGLIDFHRAGHKAVNWRAAHGTHVLDVAAGFDPRENRTDRPIVCVQLPARTTANTSGADLPNYARDALLYICDRALDIGNGQALPVVINFSYGLIGGPHDGTSELELLMELLIKERQKPPYRQTVRIVLPAGNSYLSRCHAEIGFPTPTPDVVELPWRVQPDDKTPSYLDVWLPRRPRGAAVQKRIEVSIVPPQDGEESPPLGDAQPGVLQWRPFGPPLCTLQYNEFPWPTERGRFRVTLRPTANFDRPLPIAPAGTWTIKLRNVGLPRGEKLHAWVQRDDSLYGYPRRGRQSFFDHPDYKRFDRAGRETDSDAAGGCPVRREGLLNAIATGASVVVVGGFRRKESTAALYSGGGPALSRQGPDALAVTEDSVVHGGVLAAGSRSGSIVAMGGTSVAAPQVTRWIADRLAASHAGDRGDVEDKAKYEELNRPAEPRLPARQRAGGGRIERPPVVKLPRFDGMKTD